MLEAKPDVILVSVCGFDIPRTRSELTTLAKAPVWQSLIQQVDGHVLVVDGDAFFSRPGPRLVDATEALAHSLHPGVHADPANDCVIEQF